MKTHHMRQWSVAAVSAAVPLLLAGCAAAPTTAPTVTVTAAPQTSTPRAGDSGPWDLHAVCAAESEIDTIVGWRRQQLQAHRLSPAQSAAVLQSIAVQNLELDAAGLPSSVTDDVHTLVSASGTLEHPMIDLQSPSVERARNSIAATCQSNGLTIGVIAQGG